MEPKNEQNRNKNLITASNWMAVFLADGERPVTEVYVAGEAAGFSEHQLKRARHRLDVQVRWAGKPLQTFWRLAEDTALPIDAEAWLAAFLANGECPALKVFAAGQKAGFSRDQLKSARYSIGARFRPLGYPPKSHWRLANATSAEGEGFDRPVDQKARRETRLLTMEAWLTAFLESGERSSAEILAAWKAARFPAGQLQVARRRIGVKTRQVAEPPWSFWRLDERKGQ